MDATQEIFQCSIFRSIEDENFKKELFATGYLKKYPRGSCLISPQQELNHFGVILRGKIHTLHQFSDGNCSIMDVLEELDVFGADLICTKSRIAPYHAVAAADTELLLFPWYLPFIPGHLSEPLRQTLQLRLLQLVANSNIQKEYRLAILSQKGLRERITTYLQMQAAKRQAHSFKIPFSREDLASFLCVNRSALSHELSKMQAEGIIRYHKNHFTLLSK